MNNAVLNYYFQIQFNWKNKWFSGSGLKRPIIRASNQVLIKNFVDYSILEGFILHTNAMQELLSVDKFIKYLKQELNEKNEAYYGNEIVGLEIKHDFCRPIDNLGTDDGRDGPLNWNIATPEKLQYIPTVEIFQLFDDWLAFLKEIESNSPKFET